MLIRRSSAVQLALVAGTRTRRAQQAQIRRVVNASIRERMAAAETHKPWCGGMCGTCSGKCGRTVCNCICDFL